jgi:FixJ family two-component response regulator
MSSAAGRTVAIVDDDEVVRDSLKVLLEGRNFAAIEFASGKEFLARRNGTRPGCLILDIHMPDITGLDLLKTLRDAGDQVPTILVTGRREPASEVQAAALGAVLLDKPISHASLFAALAKVFGG